MSIFLNVCRASLMILPLAISLSAILGCGYSFRATGEPTRTEIQSLAIPLIPSTASSLGFEGTFTTIIREEFLSRSKLPLVPKAEADTVLLGRISEIETEPVGYETFKTAVNGEETAYEVTARRRLTVKLDAELIDSAGGNTLWREKAMEERATFEVTDDPLRNRFNQRVALEEIARRFARRIYLKTLERF